LYLGKPYILEGLKMSWDEKIINFIIEAYQKIKSSIFIKSAEFKYFIKSLMFLVDFLDSDSEKERLSRFSSLFSISTSILQSDSNNKSFMNLMSILVSKNAISIEILLQHSAALKFSNDELAKSIAHFLVDAKDEEVENIFSIIDRQKKTDLFLSIVRAFNSEINDYYRIHESQKRYKDSMYNETTKKQNNKTMERGMKARDFVIRFHTKIIFTLIASPKSYIQNLGLNLLKECFPKIRSYELSTYESENNYESQDWKSQYEPEEVESFLNDLNNIYSSLLSTVIDLSTSTDLHQFYQKDEYQYSNMYTMQSIFKASKWLVNTLELRNEQGFEIWQMLLEPLLQENYKFDFNIVYYLDFISIFPDELWTPIFIQAFNQLKFSSIQYAYMSTPAFKLLLPLIFRLPKPDIYSILNSSQMQILKTELVSKETIINFLAFVIPLAKDTSQEEIDLKLKNLALRIIPSLIKDDDFFSNFYDFKELVSFFNMICDYLTPSNKFSFMNKFNDCIDLSNKYPTYEQYQIEPILKPIEKLTQNLDWVNGIEIMVSARHVMSFVEVVPNIQREDLRNLYLKYMEKLMSVMNVTHDLNNLTIKIIDEKIYEKSHFILLRLLILSYSILYKKGIMESAYIDLYGELCKFLNKKFTLFLIIR